VTKGHHTLKGYFGQNPQIAWLTRATKRNSSDFSFLGRTPVRTGLDQISATLKFSLTCCLMDQQAIIFIDADIF